MPTAQRARFVVSVIGNVISYGLFLSQSPVFIKICKNKTVEHFKVDPYLATVLNCIFWIIYGLPFVQPDCILIVIICSIGVFLELVYLTIYLIYFENNRRKKLLLYLGVEVIFVAVLVAVILLVLHDHKRTIAFGAISAILDIIRYISPRAIMQNVIETRSVEFMPFFPSLANFLGGCVWVAYTLTNPIDVIILINNARGALAGAMQLILYGCYFRSTPTKDRFIGV